MCVLPHSEISFIFMLSSAKILPNNRLRHTFGVGAPPQEILDPQLITETISHIEPFQTFDCEYAHLLIN